MSFPGFGIGTLAPLECNSQLNSDQSSNLDTAQATAPIPTAAVISTPSVQPHLPTKTFYSSRARRSCYTNYDVEVIKDVEVLFV